MLIQHVPFTWICFRVHCHKQKNKLSEYFWWLKYSQRQMSADSSRSSQKIFALILVHSKPSQRHVRIFHYFFFIQGRWKHVETKKELNIPIPRGTHLLPSGEHHSFPWHLMEYRWELYCHRYHLTEFYVHFHVKLSTWNSRKKKYLAEGTRPPQFHVMNFLHYPWIKWVENYSTHSAEFVS